MTSRAHGDAAHVGPYALLTQLGEGGMGIVHLAQGPDGRRVALKVLRPQVVGDAEVRGRLAREVGSLTRIRSPWIAEMLDADPWAEVPYVVTRYVPGLSLHEHVKAEGPLAGSDLLWLAGCLAEGLSAVHAAGVLHRDVKPGNVLMEGRTPILIDFGLARVAEDTRLTQTGWLLGTPGYLAAEVLYGDEATAAADVHAWAATVTYAATGRPPYGRGPAMAVMDRTRRGQHDLHGIEAPLRDVLAAALSPDPLDRPSLSELLAWLRPLSTRPELPQGRPPGVLFAAGGAAAPLDPTMPLALAGHDGPEPPAAPVTPVMPAPPPPSDEPRTAALPTDRVAPVIAMTPAPPAPPTVPNLPVAGVAADAAVTAPAPVHAGAPAPDAGALARMERHWDDQHGLTPQDPDDDPAAPGGPGASALDADGVPVLPPAPWPERLRRGVLVGLGAVALGTGAAAAPWAALAVVVAAVWVLRAGSLASSAVAERRGVRGAKWHDGPRWVVSSPWHLVRAVTGTVVLVLWSLGLAAAAGLLCYAVALDLPATLVVTGAVTAVAVWSGPGSARFRSPVGRVLVPAARTPLPWLITCAALLGVAVALGLLQVGEGVSWAPFSNGPFGL